MSAPMGLEYKNIASPDAPADAEPSHEGVIEALVAVTGVKDDVGDVIVPGAFTKTLVARKPKVCLGHDWNRPIGKTLQIKELMPGDPGLPKATAEGKPWPREAGAVWAQFQTNMEIDDGKNAFHSAKFYGPESTYSIGYKATTAKHKAGTRYIHELDLFEFGPVLHPANRLATLQSIKTGEPEGIEATDLDVDDEEKGVAVEELTLRDYAAILDIMEEKAVKIRRVSATGVDYWGLPEGTVIKPGMKPKGTGRGRTTNRGLTTAKPVSVPDAKPDTSDAKPDVPAVNSDKLAETEQSVRAVAEELGLEMRPNPTPPDYIIKPPPAVFNRSGERVMSFRADTGKAQANNGQVIPAGRVEDFLRTWQQEMDKSKDGYPPRADWVLDQMDKPAREAAAKAETDRKKREAVASATNEELAGQAEFEVDRLIQFDARQAEMRAEGRVVDEVAAERVRDRGRANLELVNAELVKRGLPAYDLPGPKLSTKPTGGRSVQEILDSIPQTREGQAPRYDIENGADVLDGPAGSGVFAVGPLPGGKDEGKRGEWTITLGNGLSIPATAVAKSVSNERAINVSTPKKVAAWLTAMSELHGADGNPPPYGTATGPELLAWRDTDGRTLKEALTEVVAPAYLKAIGKSGARSGDGGDKTKAANWRSNPALAATKLPSVMFSQFVDLGPNSKQAYILGRTEGDDHATALARAKDVIANARSARESAEAARNALPTSLPSAPVNRTIATDDNGEMPTPEGEISTTRLLSLNRTAGPAAIANMERPELERHDAELTRRAAELGKPDAVSPAHQAVKDALRAKEGEQETPQGDPEVEKVRQRLAEQTDDPDQGRRSGIPTRGMLAFTLAGERLGMVNPISYARSVLDRDSSVDSVREQARVSAQDGNLNAWQFEQFSQALAEIDTWNADFGADQDLIDRARAWVEGSREGMTQRPAPQVITSVAMEDGRVLTPIDTRSGEKQAFGITSGGHTLRVYEENRPNAPAMPWGYEIVDNTTGGRRRGNATYRSPGSALVRAENEFQETENRSAPPAVSAPTPAPSTPEQTATIAPELLDEAAESEAASIGLTETPDGALEIEPEIAERQDRVEKLIKNADDGTLNLAEQSTEDLTSTRRDLVDELRLQTAIARRAPRGPRPAADTPKVRPGLAGAAEDHAEALRSGDTAAIERTRTRLESSIRRSRVDSEIARSLADNVTSPSDNDAEQLSDLAKRLRAESRERRNATARKRRTAKRIERERLQSLLGAVDTELRGRGVELEQVAPELLAPDPEGDGRPNLTAKMRDVLLGATSDGSLDGHLNTIYGLMTHNLVERRPGGDRNFHLTPEGEAEVALLRDPKTESTSGANVTLLNQDQTIENDIHRAYAELADGPEDWIRLSTLIKRLDIPPQDWQRVLTAMGKTGLVHLVPQSNTKTITDEDRAAAVRIGGEDKHLIAFDRDYASVFDTLPAG